MSGKERRMTGLALELNTSGWISVVHEFSAKYWIEIELVSADLDLDLSSFYSVSHIGLLHYPLPTGRKRDLRKHKSR